jgi:hypothetical protein
MIPLNLVEVRVGDSLAIHASRAMSTRRETAGALLARWVPQWLMRWR